MGIKNLKPLQQFVTTLSYKHLIVGGMYNYLIMDREPRTKMKHRKTLIKEEGWIKLDDWYVGKPPPKDGRKAWVNPGRYWSYALAHKCPDGKIKAPTSVNIVKRKKKGGLGIYGRCSGCQAKINDKVKQTINMMELL